MSNLSSALESEKEIWKLVYESRDFKEGSITAFREPKYPNNPHWNLAFNSSLSLPGDTEIRKIKSFYDEKEIEGHLTVEISHGSSFYGEVAEYFLHERTSVKIELSHSLKSKETDDLEKFCEIVSLVEPLDSNIKNNFLIKMNNIKKKIPARFFVAQHGSDFVGCWSLFDLSKSFSYLMNFGIVPEFQGKKLGNELISLAVSSSEKSLYSQATSEVMRKNILPKAGFRSLGAVGYCPLKRLLEGDET